ncbi:Lysyl oxidase [Cladochytrium replicatum]|nr:Lysyl oxidase [Cladochytrium replicatum]
MEALPDFEPDSNYLKQTLSIDFVNADADPCLIRENCLSGPGVRKVLRFGTMVHNRGSADAFLGHPPSSREDTGSSPVYWHFDSCHNHFHFEEYANYEILVPDRNQQLQSVGGGHKNGFCLEDLKCPDGIPLKYNCTFQGVQKGCADIYDDSLACQWIDITELDREENLVVKVTINPNRFFPELRYDNNVAEIAVKLSDVPVRVRNAAQLRPEGAGNKSTAEWHGWENGPRPPAGGL